MAVMLNCSKCGAAYSLAPDLYARVAGQSTPCRQCGAKIVVPAAPKAVVAAKVKAADVLDYAGPRTAEPVAPTDVLACWRVGEGKKARLVIRNGYSTPPRCVRCNAPAECKPKKFREPTSTTGGGNDGIFALISLILLIFELATRKSGTVSLAVCDGCRNRQRKARWMAFGLTLAMAALIAAGIAVFVTQGQPMVPVGVTLMVLALASLIAAIVIAAKAQALPALQRVVGDELWFKPSGRDFVGSLPEVVAPVMRKKGK
jgi:hypothetical protein